MKKRDKKSWKRGISNIQYKRRRLTGLVKFCTGTAFKTRDFMKDRGKDRSEGKTRKKT